MVMEEDKAFEYTKEIAKGTIWSLIGKITFNMISFFYVILVARAVSQDDLGLFYLSLSIVTLLMVFENFGLNSSLIRYVPYFEGRNEIKKIKVLLKSSYLISFISALLLVILLWWASETIGEIYQNPRLPEALRMLSAVFLLNNFFKVNTAYLRSRADIKAMQINTNLQNFLKLILTFALFYVYGASTLTLVAGILLSYLFATLFSFVNVSTRLTDLPKADEAIPTKQLFLEIIPFGLMLSFMNSLGTFLLSADSAILGYFTEYAMATTIVAIYSVAALLAMVTYLFPSSIASIFLPVMSRLYGKNDLEGMRKVTETAQRWSLFITVPIASIFIAFSGEMLETFYGAAYVGGATVMSIYVFAVLIMSIPSVLSLALTSMKIVKLQLKVLLALSFMQIALDILLIPAYGMVGAAISFFARCIVMLIIFCYYAKKIFDFRFSRAFYKLFNAALIVMIIVLLVKPAALVLAGMLPALEGTGLQFYLSKLIYLGYLGILTAASFLIFMFFVTLSRCFRKEDVVLMAKAMKRARIPGSVIALIENVASRGIAK